MSPANSLDASITTADLEALILHVNAFIAQLREDNRIAVHQRIDQFHYMEKREELIFLNKRISELQSRIELMETQRETCYVEIKVRLAIDQGWLEDHKVI